MRRSRSFLAKTFASTVPVSAFLYISMPIMARGDLGIKYCRDDKGLCDPKACPTAIACQGDEDCAIDEFCVPGCRLPAECWCNDAGEWRCLDKFYGCAGECHALPKEKRNYTITALGTFGGPTANAYAVNNRGQVVGEADILDGTRHAFLWENGVMTDLGKDLPPPWSAAVDINDLGQVLILNTEYRSYFWDEGTLIRLEVPWDLQGTVYARAINNRGQIVGQFNTYYSFLWKDGSMTDLGDALGVGGVSDINSAGFLACAKENSPSTFEAAYWNGERLVGIGSLGGLESYSTEINDLGHVIGNSERAPGGDRVYYPFLYRDGVMIDVEMATGRRSSGALNNCGELGVSGDLEDGIVLYRLGANGALKAVRGGTPPYDPWVLAYAFTMNDYGEFVGYGYFQGLPRAYLLCPIVGDANGDGSVDLKDFAVVQTRFTGSKLPAVPGCNWADLDRDGDVDGHDYGVLHAEWSGP